jgi:hypothetical protein
MSYWEWIKLIATAVLIAAAIVREAKRRGPSGTDVSTVLDEVARSYFRHALRHR